MNAFAADLGAYLEEQSRVFALGSKASLAVWTDDSPCHAA